MIKRTLWLSGLLLLALETAGAMEKSRWVLFCLGFALLIWLLHLANVWSWRTNKKAPRGRAIPAKRTAKKYKPSIRQKGGVVNVR